MKHIALKKGAVVKTTVSSELNSKCEFDLIHLHGEYKFLIVYQDHLTKFVQVRPI